MILRSYPPDTSFTYLTKVMRGGMEIEGPSYVAGDNTVLLPGRGGRVGRS
jgi:hypothetical protein